MKKHLAVLFVVVLAGVASSYAIDAMRVTIPFDFKIGNVTLPAGEYLIAPSGIEGAMKIQKLGGKITVFAQSIAAFRSPVRGEVSTKWVPGPVLKTTADDANPPNYLPRVATGEEAENSVVFNKYGDQYFLSKIWEGTTGRELLLSKQERQLSTASSKSKAEILVAAH